MSDPVPPSDPAAAKPVRSATWLEVVPTVLASFFGVRKGASMQRDAVAIRPVQVIVVGVLAAAVLVVGLVLFVRFVIRLAGA